MTLKTLQTAPAQRLAFFPQPEQAGLVKVGIPLRVSPSCEGQSGERWHSVSLPVGLFNRWECPVGHFHHENDRTRNRGAVPCPQKETSVSGSPLVGETRQHQRGAGTETDNPSGQGERVSLSTEQEIQSVQTDLLRAILRASTLKTCDCITHVPFLRCRPDLMP